MRVVAILAAVLGTMWIASNVARAESGNCKKCSDQQRACMTNYPGKTCKTEYDICMKTCRGK